MTSKQYATRPVLTRRRLLYALLPLVAATAGATGAPPTPLVPGARAQQPLIGFTLHWDFFSTPAEGERLLRFALAQGAQVLNVVPPPHIWEQPRSLLLLRRIFTIARESGCAVLLNRIDGSAFSDSPGQRANLLYSQILTEPGRLPSGKATPDFFLATVGKPDYERWLREETRFYAENFANEPNLLGFSLGPFNEPFVSQRGSLLCWDPLTNSYEIAQYTPYLEHLWHDSLRKRFGSVARVNRELGARYLRIEDAPLPRNEHDPAYIRPDRAYWQLVRVVNGWIVAQLEDCRSLWHSRAQRDIPFVLQFSGYVPEKFQKGRPALAALDIFQWMEMADALGLSLYTDCAYPDWGHASVSAMAAFLGTARLLQKPIYVLESGSECDGAIRDEGELRFVADVAGALHPRGVIYEFLKTTYDEHFSHSSGKLVGPEDQVNAAALERVKATLLAAQTSTAPLVTPLYVWRGLLRDPAPEALAQRQALMQLALKRSLTFVSEHAAAGLPDGTQLIVPDADLHCVPKGLRKRLATVPAHAVLDEASAR